MLCCVWIKCKLPVANNPCSWDVKCLKASAFLIEGIVISLCYCKYIYYFVVYFEMHQDWDSSVYVLLANSFMATQIRLSFKILTKIEKLWQKWLDRKLTHRPREGIFFNYNEVSNVHKSHAYFNAFDVFVNI